MVLSTDVLKHLQKLNANKLPGPDIHPRLLNEIAEIIADPLTKIFQTSLSSRELPAECKVANTTLVFKKADHTKPGNYQSISLTSAVFKMFEHIVNNSILKHLTTNKILSPKHYRFQSRKLINTNLMESYKINTTLIDQGHLVDLLLLDLAKTG
ncbi:uncharacterized protein LOC136025807 [Artemia franciscana]|uniref:uncharacterized protein LOC136025807 n=1 Tax=Artemia franciscana TaxID=6661 RepID=UPI0032DBCB4F